MKNAPNLSSLLTLLSMVSIPALVLTAGCTASAPLTHVDRPMMPNRAVVVAPGELPNTVVTTTPLCSRGNLLLPSGTTLEFSYPTPYPYSPWRPVYRLRLPGKSSWWPATAVLSKSGVAYFSYFVVPTGALEALRRSCAKNPEPCCPGDASSPNPGKNPVKPHR